MNLVLTFAETTQPFSRNVNTTWRCSGESSIALQSVCVLTLQLSRPEVTKRLWKHIKGHNLQDPNDKRYILCDDAMRSVFKQDRVHMFTMTKLANEQMYAIEES